MSASSFLSTNSNQQPHNSHVAKQNKTDCGYIRCILCTAECTARDLVAVNAKLQKELDNVRISLSLRTSSPLR